MTLADILDIIVKRIKILIIIPLICFAASMFYSFEMIAPTYTASTTFMVLNQTYYDSITYNDLMIGSVLINDYQYLATTKTVCNKAAESLGLNSLSGCAINVNGITNTRMVKLSVTCTDPEKAANVANALTEELTKRISEIMKVDNITVVEQASVPTGASGPNRSKIVLTTTAIGIAAAIGIVVLLEFMDNTIQTGEDVEKYLGIPLLAQVKKLDEEDLKDD
jgi:capsular polysaccharide biosynthesis protein